MTPLDAAHAAMEAAETEESRRAFWSSVAAAELHLWLEDEAEVESVRPRLFEIEGLRYALAFDGEDRLAAFADGAAAHATMPGRRLVALLGASGLGLGLNFGAPSETLLPPDIVAWLAETAAATPTLSSGRPVRLLPPALPDAVLATLDRRLAAAEGLARHVWLARAEWEDGRKGHLLAVEEAAPGAAQAIAQSAAEAMAFAGAEDVLDVTVAAPGSSFQRRLERVALRFDLPEPQAPAPPEPKRPPRLR